MRKEFANKNKIIRCKDNQLCIHQGIVHKCFTYGLHLDNRNVLLPYISSVLYYNPKTREYNFYSSVHITEDLKPISFNEYSELIKELPLFDPRFYLYLKNNSFSLLNPSFYDIKIVKDSKILSSFRISNIEQMWFDRNSDLRNYSTYSSRSRLFLNP